MKKSVSNYLRKKRHLRYVNCYLSDIRWEIINTVVAASATDFTYPVNKHLENLGQLVRKYERRSRWLRF